LAPASFHGAAQAGPLHDPGRRLLLEKHKGGALKKRHCIPTNDTCAITKGNTHV